jgi:hypothetical protein
VSFAAIGLMAVGLTAAGLAAAPALQTRLMDVGREAQTLAAALNHSALNIANAVGAWLGGAAISAGYGWASTDWGRGFARVGGTSGLRRVGGARKEAAKRDGDGGRRSLLGLAAADPADRRQRVGVRAVVRRPQAEARCRRVHGGDRYAAPGRKRGSRRLRRHAQAAERRRSRAGAWAS